MYFEWYKQPYTWLEWWDERKGHFARAYKPVGASRANLSEVYHSSYATIASKGLCLVDAAYKDVVIALRLERSLELFGQGLKCQGAGPSGTKRRKKEFCSQSKRASEYADVLINDEGKSEGPEDVGNLSTSSSEGEGDEAGQ